MSSSDFGSYPSQTREMDSTPTRFRHILFLLKHLASAREMSKEHYDLFMFPLAARAELTCCSPFAGVPAQPGIDVHHRAEVCMTKQFLRHLAICAVPVEQS